MNQTIMSSPKQRQDRVCSLSPSTMDRSKLMNMMKQYTFKSPHNDRYLRPSPGIRQNVISNHWNIHQFDFAKAKNKYSKVSNPKKDKLSVVFNVKTPKKNFVNEIMVDSSFCRPKRTINNKKSRFIAIKFFL